MGLLRAQNGSIDQLIDQYLDPYMKSNNFAGTVYVAKAGKVLYEKSFGQAIVEWGVPNTNDTKYHLASVSKPFTSTSIITDRVGKYLPDFTQGNKITIHHLLSHTSGIVNINDFPEYDAWSLTSIPLDSIIMNQIVKGAMKFAVIFSDFKFKIRSKETCTELIRPYELFSQLRNHRIIF